MTPLRVGRQAEALADPAPGLDLPLHPISCSWLNAVEALFVKLAKRRLKRGVFHPVVALQQAINGFVAAHNRDPKPFDWQADPKAIIAAARRGYGALDSIQ